MSMELKEKNWFAALNLSEEQFGQCPLDADPLIWGFEENIITEEKYLNWATEFYQLPQIKGEFFTYSIDQSLCEKYAELAEWTPTFYPIYEWEDVLYVACLEPQDVGHGKTVCHVLSPYRGMTDLWLSMKSSNTGNIAKLSDLEPPEDEPVMTAPSEEPAFESVIETDEAEPQMASHEASDDTEDAPLPPPLFDEKKIAETLTSIDFSSANLISDSATSIAAVEEKHNPKPAVTAKTDDTKKEPPSLTPSFDLLGKSGVKPDIPRAPEPPPVAAPPAPKAVKPVAAPPSTPPSFADEEDDDDDKTPPPIMAAPPPPVIVPPPPKVANPPPVMATPPPMAPPPPAQTAPPIPPGMSGTDTAIAAAYIPEEHLLDDSMLAGSPSLETCTNVDQAMLYIFKSIKRDFSKLMWVENQKGKGFVPKYAHGPWAAAPATWTTPVNTSEPNIFRIAFNSKLPFHGPISMNDINAQYFAIWDQSRVPEHMTIYPICSHNKECLGFVVGAGKGVDFDQKNTLRKFDNIVQLTSKQLKLKDAARAS